MHAKRIITRTILAAVAAGSIATGIAVPLATAVAPATGTVVAVARHAVRKRPRADAGGRRHGDHDNSLTAAIGPFATITASQYRCCRSLIDDRRPSCSL